MAIIDANVMALAGSIKEDIRLCTHEIEHLRYLGYDIVPAAPKTIELYTSLILPAKAMTFASMMAMEKESPSNQPGSWANPTADFLDQETEINIRNMVHLAALGFAVKRIRPDVTAQPIKTHDVATPKTAIELQKRYEIDSSHGEHPNHSLVDWRSEFYFGEVRLGYWDWVAAQIEQNC